MRKNYLLLVLLAYFLSSDLFAQPTVAYFSGAATVRQSLTARGGARFARFQANATGVRQYAFHVGTVGAPDYNNNWRPYNGGDAAGPISFNTSIDPSANVNSARYNSGGGGTDGNTPSVTNGNYYTFNIGNNGASNNFMGMLETSYNPVSISSVTAPPANVYTYQTVNVSATLSANLNSGEICVIRYTTDGFATSSFINMALVSGTTYRGTIPLVTTTSTTVQYYVMTTNVTLGTLTNANADNLTLNLRNATGENVSGSNFSYTTSTVVVKRSNVVSGNFGTAGSWIPSGTPGNTDVCIIQSGHNITLNANNSCAALIINSGGTFTGSDGTPGRILSIFRAATDACPAGGLTFSNEGTFTASNGRVAFSSNTAFNPVHLVAGPAAFYEVSISHQSVGQTCGLNFGSSSSVSFRFTLNSRGYVCTNAPTYLTGSTLQYNTGGAFTAGAEWTTNATSGQGVPHHVDVDANNTAVSFSGANYRHANGNLTLNSGNPSSFALSATSGGDLRLNGNLLIPNGNAAFTSNGRAIFLTGTANQTVSNTPIITMSYLIMDKASGNVLLDGAGNLTFNGANSGSSIQFLQPNTQLIFPATAKNLAFNGGITYSTGSALQGSSTVNLTIQDGTGSSPGQFELRFGAGTENLNGLTVNRGANGAGGITLGTDLNLAGGLTLTRGTIQFGNTALRTLTAGGSFTIGTGTERVLDMSGGNLAHNLVLNGTNSFTNNLTSFLIGTGGATGSRVTYSGSGNQNVLGNTTYNRLIVSNAGTKTVTNAGNLNVHTLAISGTANLNVQNNQVVGNAAGSMSVGSGATFTITGGSFSCALFPTIYTRAQISLDPASTVAFRHNADPSISSEPVYGNLLVDFSGGSGNKNPRFSTGAGGFTTVSIAGNLTHTRTVAGGGNQILNLTLNGGFNLNVDGDLNSTGLAGTSGLQILYDGQNINVGGSSNGFGNASVGTLTGTQTGTFTYDGALPQTIRSMVYNNLTFSGAGVKTLASGAVAMRVNGVVTLTSAIVELDNFPFEISTTGSMSGTFGASNKFRTNGTGALRIYGNGPTYNFTFPVGNGVYYNPATVNLTSATFGGAAGTRYIQVGAAGTIDPDLTTSSDYLSTYWDLLSTNISAVNGSLTLVYENGQVVSSDASFAGCFNTNGSGTFEFDNGLVTPATNTILVPTGFLSVWNSGNVTGRWSGSNLANIPGGSLPFYSRQDGPWSDPNTWSNVGYGGAAAVIAPGNSGAVVRVGNGNTVTLDVNTVTDIADLEIASTGIFDIGVENFSITAFSGAGTLRLHALSGTRAFPSVTTNLFLGTSGSVVEYNSANSYSLPASPASYQTLTISGGGTKTSTGNISIVENVNVATSGTILDLSTFTMNRTAAGGTFSAATGTTVRTGFCTNFGLGQNAFPSNFSTYSLTGSTSEFYFGSAAKQTINSINYFNLVITGNRLGNLIRFDNLPTGVANTFNVSGLSNYSTEWAGGGGRINFNGTTSQFVPVFIYQRIEVSGNKGGGTVTFDNSATVSVRDLLIFTATNVSYVFTNNTIEFRGANNGTNVTLSSNPTGFPYNNIIISGDGVNNVIGADVNINGNLTIAASRALNLNTGNLTMGAGSSISILGTLLDGNITGLITLNDADITVGPSGTLDLSQSGADMGTSTGTFTFNGGTVGGAGGATSSISVGDIVFTGNGTLGRGNFTSTGSMTIPAINTLSFTSSVGNKRFNNVSIDGTWDNVANSNVFFTGNLNVNSGSTFTSGTGIHVFDGTSNIGGTFPTPITIANISVTAGNTVTNNRTAGLIVSSSMGAGTGTFLQGTNANFEYASATAITPDVNAGASGNTFTYSASSAAVRSGTYHNLVLTSGTNVIGGNVIVNGNLNLSSAAILRTNASVLEMGPGATVSGAGASSYVWGNLQKNIPTGSPSVAFEIGDASVYAPATFNFTGVSVAGDLRLLTSPPVSSTPGGALLNKTIATNRYWNVSSINTLAFTSYNGVFNFDAADLIGGAVNADLRGGVHDGVSWSYPSTTGLVGNSATLNNVTQTGQIILASCINPTPFTFSGSNGGGYCAGSSGTTLSLSGSQTGVDYQLQLGGIDVGSPVTGPGGAFNLGDYTVNGAYTVIATTGVTGCFNTMAGTVNVVTNPLPTLSAVFQVNFVCSGTNANIDLSGLLPSSALIVDYRINGINQIPVAVNSDGAGFGSFALPVTFANNGQLLEVTSITNTSLVPNCTEAFVSSNSTPLSVVPRPTVQISANEFVCLNQTAPIDFFFTGTGPWLMTYKINGVAQAPVNSPTSPYSNPYIGATVARSYDVVSLSDANCVATVAELDSHFIDVPIPCQVVWNGSVNTSWTEKDNWTPNNSAPSPNTTVIVSNGTGIPNQPNLVANATCASLVLDAASSPVLGAGVQLSIRGDLSGTGSGIITGPGKLAFTGTGIQTVTGTPRVTNVDFVNSSGAGVVIAPGGNLVVEPNGVANFVGNAKLTVNGNLTLSSNATSTAKIGPVPATANISGEISQERYLPYVSGATGSWYFMGSPFGGRNFTDWVDDFKVTGLSSAFGAQGGGIISSPEPERTTVFRYVEADHNLRIDTIQKIGWTIPGAASTITPGIGYRVFVNYFSNASHKFDNKGTLTRGDFTFPTLTRNEYAGCIPASFPCNHTNWRGWNLLANPYPCDVDWDAAGPAWTKPASMQNAWYRWNAQGSGYGVYQNPIYAGVLPAPTNPNLIPSGQSFFVRLVNAGTYTESLVVRESAKSVTTSGSFTRSTTQTNLLKLKLSKENSGNNYAYECVIRFMPEATDGYDPQLDLSSLGGSNYYFSILVDNQGMMVGSFAPITESKTVQLSTDFAGQNGTYSFDFQNLSTFPEDIFIYLKDNLTGGLTDVRAFPNVSFEVNAANIGFSNRFELVFALESATSVQSALGSPALHLIPNPAPSGDFQVMLLNGSSKGQIDIFDVRGRKVYTQETTGSASVVRTGLPKGLYRVKYTDSKGVLQKSIVIQ